MLPSVSYPSLGGLGQSYILSQTPPENKSVLWLNTEDYKLYYYYEPKDIWYPIGVRPAKPLPVDVFGDGSCIAMYRFERGLLDETGNYNLTCYGNEKYDVGVLGYCFYFDGNTHLENQNLNLGQLGQVSFSFWAKSGGSEGSQSIKPVGASNDGSGNDFACEFSYLGEYMPYCRKNLNTNPHINDGFRFDNEWHHYVLMFDNTGAYLYRDGINKGKAGQFLCETSSIFSVGGVKDTANTYHFFKGRMDLLRVFNRILTSDEINQLYNEVKTS